MATITIPKNLIKEKNLVVISRKEYEKFLRLLSLRKKVYPKFNKDLDEAIKEVQQGKTIGPFRSAKELKNSLEK